MIDGEKRQFPSTQWSLIVRAADADPAEREKALSEICILYWPPVYAFIRMRGKSPADAEDLTQGLFAELLERGDFCKMDPGRGKLRTYLLTATKNFLVSDYRREHRAKRGGHAVLLSIDALEAEERCLIPALADNLAPDRLFDRQWAISLMEAVVGELSEEYGSRGKSGLFEALRPFIQVDGEPKAQKELAAKLGISEQALRVAIHRLRQRYAEALRRAVKATLGPEESVENEMMTLLAAF
jgi:RNA polymerase sigma factor (sigma-70 family)